MSVTSISGPVKFALWGKAAGRCQYRGCNRPLWKDCLTQTGLNISYLAHIVADQADGPRGDTALSPTLGNDISNLMLLCDAHHRLIDKGDVAGHPVSLLQEMKAEHEQRIERQTSISPNMQSEILRYDANIGEHPAPSDFAECAAALLPHRYPASDRGVGLGIKNSAITDRDSVYWELEAMHLRRLFEDRVKPRLADGSIKHLSVFARAPQPLLMLLGYLMSDIPDVETFQRRREPATWKWPEGSTSTQFIVDEPARIKGAPALVFSLSATVNDDRIEAVLGDCSIWKVRVATPHHDIIQHRDQLGTFRSEVRKLLDRIKAACGSSSMLHVFPAMPISTAVQFGRVIQPKAEMEMTIYDEQQPHGFRPALTLRRATQL